MSDLHALTFTDVYFSYTGAMILENVNFTVEKGGFLSIVGPNGGGKTTLLKLILGLLKPAVGRVSVLGKSPEHARRRIGYMPQYTQFDPHFPITVMDVVIMGYLNERRGGAYSRSEKRSAAAALDEVGLSHLTNRSFSELSGGQRQRVLISRALVCRPDILLLDEPTANIDAEVEGKLQQILQKLNVRMTILVATHDLGFVSKLIKNVICVNRTVAVHPTGEISGKVIRELYRHDQRLVRHDKFLHKGADRWSSFSTH